MIEKLDAWGGTWWRACFAGAMRRPARSRTRATVGTANAGVWLQRCANCITTELSDAKQTKTAVGA